MEIHIFKHTTVCAPVQQIITLFDEPPWALIKLFLDLYSGRLFEVGPYSRLGAYKIFTIFSKCNMFILQQNNKW